MVVLPQVWVEVDPQVALRVAYGISEFGNTVEVDPTVVNETSEKEL